MNRPACLLLAALLICTGTVAWADAAPPAATPKPPAESLRLPGEYEVTIGSYTWHDAARNRDVPAKIYCPKSGTGPFPVIIFSHGLGGSCDGYAFLGQHWASHGLVSVHLTHLGSDTSVWKDNPHPMKSMVAAAANLQLAVDRPKDVSFAIDQLTALNQSDAVLKGLLDLQHIGVAGHSFGGFTVLACAGETLGPGKGTQLGDPRIKAAIAMSAPVQNRPNANWDQAFHSITIPILHLTGTKDDSPIGNTKAADRRIPFDHAGDAADSYLAIFAGGDHMVFSGVTRTGANGDLDARQRPLILLLTTAFWDAYLRDIPAARKWLATGGAKDALGDAATYESKLTTIAAGITPAPAR